MVSCPYHKFLYFGLEIVSFLHNLHVCTETVVLSSGRGLSAGLRSVGGGDGSDRRLSAGKRVLERKRKIM